MNESACRSLVIDCVLCGNEGGEYFQQERERERKKMRPSKKNEERERTARRNTQQPFTYTNWGETQQSPVGAR